MHTFIIAATVIIGLIMGLKATHAAVADGESIKDARLHGLIGGGFVAIVVVVVLYVLYGLAWLYWGILTMPGAY